MEPVGGQGGKGSYNAWRECEAKLLSEKPEQRAGKKAEAAFPRKTKIVQERKLIIVHFVPYLRIMFIQFWCWIWIWPKFEPIGGMWGRVGARVLGALGVQSFYRMTTPQTWNAGLPNEQHCPCALIHQPSEAGCCHYFFYSWGNQGREVKWFVWSLTELVEPGFQPSQVDYKVCVLNRYAHPLWGYRGKT